MRLKVVANGTLVKGREGNWIPQGTVLASVLFVIMVSDQDREVKESIEGCFAGDTRVRQFLQVTPE